MQVSYIDFGSLRWSSLFVGDEAMETGLGYFSCLDILLYRFLSLDLQSHSTSLLKSVDPSHIQHHFNQL